MVIYSQEGSVCSEKDVGHFFVGRILYNFVTTKESCSPSSSEHDNHCCIIVYCGLDQVAVNIPSLYHEFTTNCALLIYI